METGITAKLLVNSSRENTFKHINKVAGWWTENVEGNSNKLNDEFTVHFGNSFVNFKVIEFEVNERVVWLVTDCYLGWLENKKEWSNTKIIFEISKHGDQTQVDFTHVGLLPGIECYTDCVKGWDQYFTHSLNEFISEGAGSPAKKTKVH